MVNCQIHVVQIRIHKEIRRSGRQLVINFFGSENDAFLCHIVPFCDVTVEKHQSVVGVRFTDAGTES